MKDSGNVADIDEQSGAHAKAGRDTPEETFEAPEASDFKLDEENQRLRNGIDKRDARIDELDTRNSELEARLQKLLDGLDTLDKIIKEDREESPEAEDDSPYKCVECGTRYDLLLIDTDTPEEQNICMDCHKKLRESGTEASTFVTVTCPKCEKSGWTDSDGNDYCWYVGSEQHKSINEHGMCIQCRDAL